MLKVILLTLSVLALGCSAGAQDDPCASVTEPSVMSLVPGSKHSAVSALDPEYKAALAALVNARIDVQQKETAMLASVGSGLYAQRSRAEIARDVALRDAGVYSDFSLTQANITGVCLESDAYRLDRLTTDSALRRDETVRLTQASKRLVAEAALSAQQLRQKYVDQTEGILAQGKQPAKALADLKTKLATVTKVQQQLKAGR